MEDCCRKGFRWVGEPTGREDKLEGNRAYVVGNSNSRAVLICHDAFGWEWTNTRLLADHYAQEVGATVYVPDFYHGWSINSKDASVKITESGSAKLERNEDFDWQGWFSKNGVDARMPEVIACAKLLRQQYNKVGAVGYCWGGQAGFKLAAKELEGLFDCISIAHPGPPTPEEIRGVSVPFQIIAPEYDHTFSAESKRMCNEDIPKAGVEYAYLHFPGLVHGFATKCDLNNAKEKKAMETAKNAVVFWLANHL